ncbi:MAG: hypothetical protein QM820_28050 [Minicystis sp.]
MLSPSRKRFELGLGEPAGDVELLLGEAGALARGVGGDGGVADLGEDAVLGEAELGVEAGGDGLRGLRAAAGAAAGDGDLQGEGRLEDGLVQLGVAGAEILRGGEEDVERGEALVPGEIEVDAGLRALGFEARDVGAARGRGGLVGADAGRVGRRRLGQAQRQARRRRRDGRAGGVAEVEGELVGGLGERALGGGDLGAALEDRALVLGPLQRGDVAARDAHPEVGVARDREIEPRARDREAPARGHPVPVALGREPRDLELLLLDAEPRDVDAQVGAPHARATPIDGAVTQDRDAHAGADLAVAVGGELAVVDRERSLPDAVAREDRRAPERRGLIDHHVGAPARIAAGGHGARGAERGIEAAVGGALLAAGGLEVTERGDDEREAVQGAVDHVLEIERRGRGGSADGARGRGDRGRRLRRGSAVGARGRGDRGRRRGEQRGEDQAMARAPHLPPPFLPSPDPFTPLGSCAFDS